MTATVVLVCVAKQQPVACFADSAALRFISFSLILNGLHRGALPARVLAAKVVVTHLAKWLVDNDGNDKADGSDDDIRIACVHEINPALRERQIWQQVVEKSKNDKAAQERRGWKKGVLKCLITFSLDSGVPVCCFTSRAADIRTCVSFESVRQYRRVHTEMCTKRFQGHGTLNETNSQEALIQKKEIEMGTMYPTY